MGQGAYHRCLLLTIIRPALTLFRSGHGTCYATGVSLIDSAYCVCVYVCVFTQAFFPKDQNIIVDLQDQTPPASITSQIPCTGGTLTCSGLSVPLQAGACASLRQQWLQWAMGTAKAVRVGDE